MWHELISKPISISRRADEDQDKKWVVTRSRPIISRADFPRREMPGSRNAELAASKIRNRNLRDDLLCTDIRHLCVSSLHAEPGLGRDYGLFP